jgi:hypothetical protein
MFCVYVLRNASNGKYYIGYYGISGQRIALSTKDCFAKFRLVGLERFGQPPHARKGLCRKTLLLSLFFREVS